MFVILKYFLNFELFNFYLFDHLDIFITLLLSCLPYDHVHWSLTVLSDEMSSGENESSDKMSSEENEGSENLEPGSDNSNSADSDRASKKDEVVHEPMYDELN